MNTTAAQVNPAFAPVAIPKSVWWVVIAACVGSGIAGLLGHWYYAVLPLVISLIVACLFRPQWGVYAIICALFLPYSLLPSFNLYAADFFSFLVIISVWSYRLTQRRLGLIRTPLDVPTLLFLGVMALSLVNAYDTTMGAINWLRHVQLFLLFYALVLTGSPKVSRQALNIFVAICAILSLTTITPFLSSGGTDRYYGIARISFNGLLTLGGTYLAARICFTKNRRDFILGILLLGVLLLGQVGTQSRAALAAMGLGIIMSIIFARSWGRRNNVPLPIQRANTLIYVGIIAVSITIIILAPLFQVIIDRYAGVGNAATTMNYRQFLWRTAISQFADHPVLGIGLGQVKVWQHLQPSLRLDPIGPLTFGLGAHMSFMKYLAETGLLGITALLLFFGRVIHLGRRAVRATMSSDDAGHIIGLWAGSLIIIIRTFVEGGLFYAVTGICTVVFFGFLCSHYLRNYGTTAAEIHGGAYRRYGSKAG